MCVCVCARALTLHPQVKPSPGLSPYTCDLKNVDQRKCWLCLFLTSPVGLITLPFAPFHRELCDGSPVTLYSDAISRPHVQNEGRSFLPIVTDVSDSASKLHK